MYAPKTPLTHLTLSDVSLLRTKMIVGPPYPKMEYINRLDDKPFASEENRRCHLPEARVSDVQDRANRSKEEDAGAEKNVLDGEL